MLRTIEKPREQGFTLIEVLVALLILALVCGVVFQTMSASTLGLERSRNQRDALFLAESSLAQAGHVMPLRQGRVSGVEGAMKWTVDVGAQLEDPPPASGIAAYPLSVAVTWTDDRGQQQLKLDSTRLGPQQITQ